VIAGLPIAIGLFAFIKSTGITPGIIELTIGIL